MTENQNFIDSSEKRAKRILYIVHDGTIYGSQNSLRLLLESITHTTSSNPLSPGGGGLGWGGKPNILPYVSLARSGDFENVLKKIPNLTLLRHKRLQWFKHDKRSLLQQVNDIIALLINLPCRVLPLYKVIKNNHIDLVHTNSVVSLEGALAAKLAGVPHVWHIRELFMEDSPKLIPVFGKSLSRKIIEACSDQINCISGAVQNQFFMNSPDQQSAKQNEHWQKKHPIIYNALSPEQIHPERWESEKEKLFSEPLKLGFAGRLSVGKRLHDVLDALVLLREKLPEALWPSLKVAGNFVDDEYKQLIENKIKEHQLESHVQLSGYESDLPAWFTTIDLLVVPSKNEPFGRVVIEAMACGIPCIGADSGGIPEIINFDQSSYGQTGWLFETSNPSSLADQLFVICRNPNVLNQIAQNAGRMIQKRFTIDQQRQMICHQYDDLIAHF